MVPSYSYVKAAGSAHAAQESRSRRRHSPAEGYPAVTVQQVLPVVLIDRAIRLERCVKVRATPEIQHREAPFSRVYGHYGPVPTSPLVAVVPSSETVALASTVVPASS